MIIDKNQLLGQRLGSCVLERFLGQGGMGAVYLAQQMRPRRTVAVKVLLPELLPRIAEASTEFVARFRREADAIAALDHVNIIPIFEYGEQEQMAYLVMPYMTGGTLRDLLIERGMLSIEEAIPILEQTAAALDYAHAHGIVHRDLKPANILFHADGRLLLTDFGIAKMINEAPADDQTFLHALTSTGTIIGTPEYLSPEQATTGSVDPRSDIYSLGIVLFHMLSGHVPFTGPTPVAIALKHTMEEPPSITQLNPALPPAVEAVMRKALAKRPEDRYATAGEFARAFVAASHAPMREFFSDRTIHDADRLPVVATGPGLSSSYPQNPVQPGNQPALELPTFNVRNNYGALPVATTLRQPYTENPSQATFASEKRQRLDVPAVRSLPQSVQGRRGRRVLGIVLLVSLLALLIIVGRSAIISGQLPGKSLLPAAQQQTGSDAASSSTAAADSTVALPKPSIAVGRLLYGTTLPACNPQQKHLWHSAANIQVTCMSSTLQLSNPAGGSTAGVLLNSLPSGVAIPANYVLQVQVQEPSSSQGAFGIVFRTQTDYEAGFSFLIKPSGSWAGNTYDGVAHQTTQLYGRQSPALNAHGFTTIAIAVQGDTFVLYFDGVEQGRIESSNYPNGLLGLVVEPGTQVQFKNLALYTLPGAA